MNVGQRIREFRESLNFSQNKLAEWAGVSQTHLRRVERGEADITVGHLQLICDALGITLQDFFAQPNEQEELSAAISTLTPKQRQLLISFLKSLQKNVE
ncbi:MAG: helix-turn-helix transcriptional regulator [Clostridia bacterium]|nr:helix-turn-helix transcriptional regulator [Clostridia bacterium]